jgi:hypothetical protein
VPCKEGTIKEFGEGIQRPGQAMAQRLAQLRYAPQIETQIETGIETGTKDHSTARISRN